MTSKDNYVTIDSNKIVNKLNDLFIGEDRKDILNINSKLLVKGVENILLPKPNNNEKGKLVKLNNTGNEYDLLELKENNTRVHKICNMEPGEDISGGNTSAQLDFWTGIKPVDGDLILKKNEEVIYFINISGFQYLDNDTLVTWKLSYKIKGDTNYTDFTDSNRDSDGTFSHNFDSTGDHQHRAFQIYYKADNDIIIDAFKVTVLTSEVSGDSSDFLSINALILSDGNSISKYITEYPLAGAGGPSNFTVHASSHYTNYPAPLELANNIISNSSADFIHMYFNGTNSDNPPAWIGYEFTTPQVVTSFRIWPRSDAGTYTSQNIKTFELRGYDSKEDYDNNSSNYIILYKSTSDEIWNYVIPGTNKASDNLNYSKLFKINNIRAYKYYVLNILENYGYAYVTFQEWALYTSYTLPSQIGNSGRQLITDGINLGWGGPISSLNTAMTKDDKYKLLKLNEKGILEYSSTDAIQLPSGNNSQRPIAIDGMIRYNNESNNMEVVENGSWKIVNTNNFNEASMGLINRIISDTSYDDEYNNSFGYYYHNRTLCPLYSEKLVYNVWHKLNFDKVFYDHSPNTNMINLLYNKIYVKETGDYLLTYSSSFKSTGGTDLNTKFKFRIYKNEDSLLYDSQQLYESKEFQAIQTQINSTNHYFIPEFNHVLNLQQNDCISLYLYHTNNGSNSILLSYDYLGGQLRGLNYSKPNLYNYEYIKTIASKLCIKKILNN